MKATEDKFIEVWLQAYRESRNRAWVAKQLGLTNQGVSYREAAMRKQGADLLPDLPRYRRSAKQRLNEIIKRGMTS